MLEYGEQLRVVPQLRHLALRVYLGCPVRVLRRQNVVFAFLLVLVCLYQTYGTAYIRQSLERMPPLTEDEGRKLLSFADATQQTEVYAVICKTLASRAAAAGQHSAMAYWLLQVDDTR